MQDIDPNDDQLGAAEELRYAAQALGRVTGQVYVADILPRKSAPGLVGLGGNQGSLPTRQILLAY